MEALSIRMVAANDVQQEKQQALGVLADLNAYYGDRLELILLGPQDSSPPDLTLILVWTEADSALQQAFGSSASEKRVLQKTAAVPLDLSDSKLIARRLEQKQSLDALLARHAAEWQLIPFSDSLIGVLERDLKALINRRLGAPAELPNLRPRLGDTYLTRQRLLQQLPDSGSHVVVLEAPYGYGKSVLAAQWAAQLEADDWRIIWLAQEATHPDLTPLLAAALGVAADTPAILLREQLWSSSTLLVIEDLQGDEDLTMVLDNPAGLVLLSSRNALSSEALDQLAQAGQLSRLDANALAFSLSEAQQLTADAATGAALHANTLGWSLPLHVASLTGTPPDGASLLAGIRASLSVPDWREFLFLAALPYMPQDAATNSSERLVTLGFVQRLETGLRLHPFMADVAFVSETATISEVVGQEANRLPLLLQGEAFERCQDYARLRNVVENTEAELWKHAPTRLLDWDRLLGDEASYQRDLAVGAAYNRLSQFDLAIERLDAALALPDLTADEQLAVMRHLCLPLAVQDNTRGQALLNAAEPLLEKAKADLAGHFLNNASIIYAYANDHKAALQLTERALEYFPANSDSRLGAEINAGHHRFHMHGDFDGRLHMQHATLANAERVYPVQAVGQCRDLAMFHWWQGHYSETRKYLERARASEDKNATIALEARAALAFLDGDTLALDEFAGTAQLFDNGYLNDVIAMYRLFNVLSAGDFARASYLFEQSPQGVFAATAYARILAAQDKHEAALALLDSFADNQDRIEQLYLSAARYDVTRDPADLQLFIDLTLAGTRLLPGFIPIDTLPDSPELARHYPVQEVLASGWKEAIRLRQEDIPDLELTLLAETSATLLGEPLELTDRQKQILVLLTLGLNRDSVAEAMWPEVEVKKQRNNLNVQLNTLRKIIEPWGVATYLFEDGLRRVRSDYRDLQNVLESGNAAEVFRLYREPFAPGLDVAVLSEERERLREDVVSLLYEASTPDEAAATAYLKRVLELEPLHEDALQALLKQLLRRGRRREARRHYQRFADTLKRDMGLEPLAETQQLLD